MPPILARNLTLLVITALIVLSLVALALVGRPSAIDERCRFRLYRLGGALDAWVEDHGHAAFPAIVNPEPGTAWEPGRPGSAAKVLWEYLGGDMPERRLAGETDAQHLARRRSTELTLCPGADLEYRYNDAGLAGLKPADLSAGKPPEIWYFRCPRQTAGAWPHRHGGKDGVLAVVGSGQEAMVDRAGLEDLRRQLAALEADTSNAGAADRPERITQLRQRVADLDQAMAGTDRAVMKRLTVEPPRFEVPRD
jgi:hypothetical protein